MMDVSPFVSAAGIIDFLAVVPDIRRTYKYRQDLHGSAVHELLHVISNVIMCVISVLTGSYIGFATEGFVGVYKSLKLYCLLCHRFNERKKRKTAVSSGSA